LEGALTCNLKFSEHCVLDKKTKVKFDTVIHYSKELLDYGYIDVLGPTKTILFESNRYFISFVDNLSRRYWVYAIRQKFKVLICS